MDKQFTKKNAGVDEVEVGKKGTKHSNTCLLIRIILDIFSHGLKATVVLVHICTYIIESFCKT